MVACEKCNEWYHDTCLGISRAELEKVENFVCIRCMDVGHGSLERRCDNCDCSDFSEILLMCRLCSTTRHTVCCDPPLLSVPINGSWICDLHNTASEVSATEKMIPLSRLKRKVPENDPENDGSSQEMLPLAGHALRSQESDGDKTPAACKIGFYFPLT